MTITEFLNARYDEEELRAAIYRSLANDLGRITGVTPSEQGEVAPLPAAHIAIQRTADRIISDTTAKRSIVALHSHPSPACYWSHDSMEMHEPGEDCDTLRLLAQPYAEHADFDRGWRA